MCNITHGVHAQATVNIDNARHIGNPFLENMAGVTLSLVCCVKINGGSIQVGPLLLFQRLPSAGKTDLVTVLQHELS